jgi:uncharacterized protein (TIGR03790 family)
MRRTSSFLSLLLPFIQASFALALTPDEIALVVNRNVPESIQLAQFYAQARNIPDGRIIELDLPKADEIPFDTYENQVTPQVRQFLRTHALEQKVRCLLTFYGVPLRIGDRVNTVQDSIELDKLKRANQKLVDELSAMVRDAEARAAKSDSTFKPTSSEVSQEALSQRMQRAVAAIETDMRSTKDDAHRQELTKYLNNALLKVTGSVAGDDLMPATAQADLNEAQVKELGERPYDPEARERVRRAARRQAGVFAYLRLVQAHIDYLSTKETGAAFDSELALMWWPLYPRARWQPNLMALNPKPPGSPPVIMVMRLDAPTPQIVRDIIATSIRVEREGLNGKFVIDSRGIKPVDAQGKPDAFGIFDEHLRKLAQIVKTRSNMQMMLDEKPEVLPPNSVDNVALYCGWYSLYTYVPAMKFNPGAVGYHVASFELLSLRDPAHPGWVRGLLENEVVASVGPVAEPYLHSFPPPDAFFPLLMTGSKPLAEVYWTTVPMTSWMQTCIGDPLYTPFAKNPRMKVEDLPVDGR